MKITNVKMAGHLEEVGFEVGDLEDLAKIFFDLFPDSGFYRLL